MSLVELVEAYNEVAVTVGFPTVTRFSSKAIGICRCRHIMNFFPAQEATVTNDPNYGKQRIRELNIKKAQDLLWKNWATIHPGKTRPSRVKVNQMAKKSFVEAERDASASVALRDKKSRTRATVVSGAPLETKRKDKEQRVIRLFAVKGKTDNPRRPGTAAHLHYEHMRGGVTVAEYLATFPPEERKTALQWLSNTIRDKHAELVG